MQYKSQTDWERARREAGEDGPIPYDEQDRLDGLYDPNNNEEVEQFFRTAEVTVTRRGPQGVSVRRLVSLQLPPEVVERYQAQGENWKERMEERLSSGLL